MGMSVGLLLLTVTVSAWLSPPAVMPERLTFCRPASSLMVMFETALIVGGLFTGAGLTVIVKTCGALTLTPPLAVPPLSPSSTVTEADLIEFAKGRLAAHKYPRSVTVLPQIPLTSVGKLDRKRLRAAVAEAVVPGQATPAPAESVQADV